jgi:hypothetical protein
VDCMFCELCEWNLSRSFPPPRIGIQLSGPREGATASEVIVSEEEIFLDCCLSQMSSFRLFHEVMESANLLLCVAFLHRSAPGHRQGSEKGIWRFQ